MTTPKVFTLDGVNKVFQADVPIKGRDYVVAYISATGLTNSYTLVSQSLYSIINDAIVFNIAPVGTFLRVVVGSNRSELLNAPNNTANVSANMDAINYVAGNIDAIVNAYSVIATAENITVITDIGNSLGSIVTVGDSLSKIDTINSNIGDIDNVGSNIAKVITVANNITNVNTVSNNLTNINIAGLNISNINNVGGSIDNVNLVVPHLSNIDIVASDLSEPVSEINTVAVNINNVNLVGASIDNVNTVAINIASIVNKAKFKVRSEATLTLADKTDTKFPVITALPDMVGFEVHNASNSVKNISGRDLDIIGSMAVQITTTSTTDIPVYVYSETSTDGINFTINLGSLRKIKVVKEGTDYLTVPSLLTTTRWVNGTYIRFRFYKEGSGSVTITSVTDTVNGNTLTGNAFLWTLHEL